MGVVGVGSIGQVHLRNYAASRNVRAVAVADLDRERAEAAAAEHGIEKVFTDYRGLLALDEVDAVSVCTPPFAHAQVTCDAAKAGKHVLCEKPMAMNAKQAEEMVMACRKAGVKLGIGSARSRFDPAVEEARQYVSSGRLGRVYYARVSTFRRRGRPGLDMLKGSKWFLDSSKAGGGALTDIGCYDIDVVLYLLGSPQPVAASAITFRGVGGQPKLETPYDVEEHASLLVRFEGGVAATFEIAWASNMDHGEGLILFGTEGGLRLNPFTLYTEQEGRHVAITTELPRQRDAAWQLLVRDFAAACLQDRAPKTPGEDGLKVMQITDMAYLSAKSGREAALRDLK